MSKATKTPVSLTGVLSFHSETGTEGGYWAFQDEKFIEANTTRFSCTKCGLYWDKEKETEEQVLEKAARFEHLKSCPEHDFALVSPENWSYEGLHVLKNGDELKIFSKDNPSEVVWSGTIKLRAYRLFTEHASGYWIHADQVGEDRDEWAERFFKGNRAELTAK